MYSNWTSKISLFFYVLFIFLNKFDKTLKSMVDGHGEKNN